ncbi:MAG: tRNA (5-methylaminomethyl-2-thiouridine)(34)-methyltransferase MnmD [Dysgonamonadaceae bacterium]|jgi:tRNA U34 5-methylaminomethyl-2-thiouridine-forming methyltransferase MnmC|nr:tRNA (5-methylaminomethyl-2-thiouridine)(34)-methyltransferase MnmD [Dysgonamonadaceae bacterium]
MFNKEIQFTADGSHTLFIPEMDEHYHSVNGAIQESMHVFIDAGLKQCKKEKIQVLELGLGTGLNAFLSCIEADKTGIEIYYTGLEKYPLPVYLAQKLNYQEQFPEDKNSIYLKIHQSEWNFPVKITQNFTLEKIITDFSDYDFPGKYDVVYYDAFAPDKQTSVWTQEIFNKLYTGMESGGILTTYCAKGSVRRMMEEAGLDVERIPGPPGKRQMLRAVKKRPARHTFP